MLFHHSGEPGGLQGRSVRTHPGFLVYMGQIASQLTIKDLLAEGVRVKQKNLQFAPADKLVQTLVGKLSGCQYMKDLTFSANTLSQDNAVAAVRGL